MKQSYFSDTGKWFKGNLHTHSTVSDGKQTPEERVNAYKKNGYSFLAFTDHNILTAYPDLCSGDFIVLPGVERNMSGTQTAEQCIHVVGISEKEYAERIAEETTKYPVKNMELDWQMLLNEMISHRQLTIIAHPVWSRMTIEQLEKLDGNIGIEVYNNTCEVACRTGNSEYMMDSCLRKNKNLYLFATDDCHSSDPSRDMFGGWIVVKADNLTQKDLLDQIKKGNFYSSTGPEIYDFGIKEQTLYVECSPCESINFITYERRGKSFRKTDITSAEYELKGTETYVRCECVDKYGKSAYTNPIFFNKQFYKRY